MEFLCGCITVSYICCFNINLFRCYINAVPLTLRVHHPTYINTYIRTTSIKVKKSKNNKLVKVPKADIEYSTV